MPQIEWCGAMLSDEIGAGEIRADIQRAIESELLYRLTGRDTPGALSRKEKELLLLAFSGVKLNACLCQLHARAAVRAGATVDEVAHAAATVIMTGMIRWKMAGMGAYMSSIDEARSRGAAAWASRDTKMQAHKRRELEAYVHKVLNREFPDMWETLADAAPGVLEGYMRLRQDIVRADPETGALHKAFIELTIAASDILQANSWGAQMHIRQAIRDGATVEQAVEAVALAMIEGGTPVYQTGGREVLEAAESEAASGSKMESQHERS